MAIRIRKFPGPISVSNVAGFLFACVDCLFSICLFRTSKRPAEPEQEEKEASHWGMYGLKGCSTSRYFRYNSFGEQVVLQIGRLCKKKEKGISKAVCNEGWNIIKTDPLAYVWCPPSLKQGVVQILCEASRISKIGILRFYAMHFPIPSQAL